METLMVELDLARPLARGRTAEIFAWDGGHVIKLFLSGCPPENVAYEAGIARKVHASGLPVPSVKAIVEHSHRYGIIYERVDGVSLLQVMMSRPWLLARAARLLARLQVAVHDRPIQ